MADVAINANAGAGSGISRREFLYYIWGASIALFAAESAGLLVWFLIPKFREGEFGGRFTYDISQLPPVNAAPANFADGRFWLSNLDTDSPNELMYRVDGDDPDPAALKGVVAIYKVCTHLGCIYAWTPANNRFECPCHGSKYRLDGRRIESPAPRTLDRFKVYILADDKQTVLAESPDDEANDFFLPVELPDGAAYIQIDTGDRKKGPEHQLISELGLG